MSMLLDRISEIAQQWFLVEEAFFCVFCTHRVVECKGMKCHARVGKGIIEVNPDLCDDITDTELEERLRIEVIRILLKHPYERQPEGCSSTALSLGSNCVIGDSFTLREVKIEHPADFNLPPNGHFEFYARHIQQLLQTQQSLQGDDEQDDDKGNQETPSKDGTAKKQRQSELISDSLQGDDEQDGDKGNQETPSKDGTAKKQRQNELISDSLQDDDEQVGDNGNQKTNSKYNDLTKNWEQDELLSAQINEIIRDIKSWGTLPGKLVEQIVASTKVHIDYRKILAGFRTSVISQKRRLTRMRPNRRSGFDAMGSRYEFTTRMIIGVDCSGSITGEYLSNFYGTINRFFQYGIRQIDVVQFDAELGEVETLMKASQNIKITGRGGTDFQPFIDFIAEHSEYDGAIIYTDGDAPPPSIPSALHTPLCWVLQSELSLYHRSWMQKSGRVCVIGHRQ